MTSELSAYERDETAAGNDRSGKQRCPFCAEEIQAAAVVCRYCNRDLAAPPPLPVAAGDKRKGNPWIGVLVLLAGFGGCVAWMGSQSTADKQYPFGAPDPTLR